MIKKDFKLILASSSPRRKKILEEMGFEFEIIPSDYEEVLENSDFSYEKIENLAYYKAKAVLPLTSASLILSADTVVVSGNEILGKPKNNEDAICMLKRLSGEKHSVVTSICVINSVTLKREILSTTSYVEFCNLTEGQIEHYVEHYKPLDKAGSYGIQELPPGFVKNIEGSFENIIGLCPEAVRQVFDGF